MKRTRHTPEQVIRKLREADGMLADHKSIAEVAKQLGVSEQTTGILSRRLSHGRWPVLLTMLARYPRSEFAHRQLSKGGPVSSPAAPSRRVLPEPGS